MFCVEQLRRDFRAACSERGIDPLEGANSFECAAFLADFARRTHGERMAALVESHAAQYPDAYGGVDAHKLGLASARDWWIDSLKWRGWQGARITIGYRPTPFQEVCINGVLEAPTENAALKNIHDEAKTLEIVLRRRLSSAAWAWRRTEARRVMLAVHAP